MGLEKGESKDTTRKRGKLKSGPSNKGSRSLRQRGYLVGVDYPASDGCDLFRKWLRGKKEWLVKGKPIRADKIQTMR
jgi:hypothetical protein